MFLKLKEMFDSLPNQSYLGITIHWINPNNFNRESAALACLRLIGNHTHEAIAAAIEEILAKYVNLLPKITMAVTNNGSNFVKAFSEYGKEFNDNNSSTTVNIQVEENSVGEDLDDENTQVQLISISKILDAVNADEESSNYYLPPHFCCAAHTMNLMATKDADKSLQANTRYKKYLRSGFAKATVLWNKYSKSPLAADTIHEITGCALIDPCE
uniref:DUF659 domain-containing protein n=1 Tax=Strigamia maritima TaxID=126957 RepID=T1J3L4_STRMM